MLSARLDTPKAKHYVQIVEVHLIYSPIVHLSIIATYMHTDIWYNLAGPTVAQLKFVFSSDSL